MAVTNARDIELLAKQNRCRQDDEKGQGKVERPRLKAERLPNIPDCSEDRQRNRQELVKKKDQPKRSRPRLEKSRQGFRSCLATGNMMRDETKGEQPEGIGNGKRQKTEQAELRRKLDEKNSPRPHIQESAIELPQSRVANHRAVFG